MNFFAEAFAWIFDPAHFAMVNGIWPRTVDHLFYTAVTMLIAMVIAIPLGLLIGHTGRGRNLVIVTTSAARALPTLGFLLFIILFSGLGLWPFVIVMVVLAVPPLLAGVYSGLEGVDRQTIDAARAVGMSEWQIIGRVEIPLALPLILGGIRSSVLQVIATATIAGYVGLTGLGRFLIEGLALRDYTLAIVGAILVAVLALAVDGLLALIQRLVVPRGVSRGMARTISTRSRRPTRLPAMTVAPIKEG
ncbi:ABC transporter permease subunit [Leifsonia bigeumensis]|uniref:ABC transporter permease subunit n=1 Tax=Leifsonella bigeumensis TaxID=433643 RepID=A0ABP7FN45_9MICO